MERRNFEIPISGVVLVPPLVVRLCKLVVWDFDKTVLRIHSYGEKIKPGRVCCTNTMHSMNPFADRMCVYVYVCVSVFTVARDCVWACGSRACCRATEMVPFRNLAEDFCDLEFFKLLVQSLRMHGVHVAIASFGVYGVIQVRALSCDVPQR